MRSVIMVGIILIAGCSSPPPPSAPVASEVTLNVVKLPELEKVIASHQGKVVVLDMWAEY